MVGGPPDAWVLGDFDPEFLGERPEPAVVPAALPARVLDPPHVGEGVRGLVQQPCRVRRPVRARGPHRR